MASQELLPLVQAKLNVGENVASIHEASLMQGWVRTSRILALVEKDGNYGLFILLTSHVPPQTVTDLTIDRVLAIDTDFRCDIDAESKHQDGTDVYVNITSKKLKLLFEMIPGMKTSNFVGDLFRAIDYVGKKRGGTQEFQWLSKYNLNATNTNASNVTTAGICGGGTGTGDEKEEVATDALLLDSPEIAVPRQSIAKGTTPIAARESVIRYQMAMKEDDYTFTQVLKVYIATWNVNGQPPLGSLTEWLACDPEPPDIYAIGFQELDLSKEAFLFNDTPREDEWRSAVMNSLHPKATYRKIALVRLVGMMLLVFVQEHHAAYVRAVATETVGTGIMGKLGNKGGVCVRFDLHSTSMCFVNSHLAAHVEEYERRNQDFHDICSRATFARFLPPKGIKDHDQIYWLGDLNYRITEMDPHVVKELVDISNYNPILECDQLKQQHKKGNVFSSYKEGDITFRPTYKYDPGTDDWDSSEKNRAPAWCDRVLWRGEAIKQLSYKSHPQLRISDHKPVSAVFSSEIRVIDTVRYRKIHEEVMKKLDKLENEFLPQVMVDNTEVIFDVLRFLEPQTKDLIIANTGQVPVQFEFIKKLDDTSYCKDWLHIEPYMGFIMPGEKCDIKLEVYVDKKSACKLNSGQDKLYDILVLHLEGGKDIFITVTGTYERSCFGSSIEALVHVTVPIREVPVGKLMELENTKEVPHSHPYAIPKEIWFLVDHLYRHGLKQQHLFEHPGLHSELIQIRNWLDNGSSDPLPGSVHSVAEALLLLLESTAEPIIPYNLHNVCLGAASNYMQCKQIVMQLPDHSKNVFLYLCSFLQELLSHTNDNGLDAKTIATLFGAIFLRDPPRSRSDLQSRTRSNQQTLDRKKANFVYHFLVNDQSELIMGCS
ncbi:oculocerebrorenal syndrome of Lowe [Lycorma delicatula]|uniref:oculocerebrorenal syndrome of Lowe n=1 Tax=Lycorma delicatula TaxID=130591 RepID=UPI003F515B93